jgi:DNA-binding SARP family transcriptional activator/ABC-type glycerol-3-phosphate transport system substrate-binding protein
MEIWVLGSMGATEAGRQIDLGGRRQRAVLAGLIVHADTPVSTEKLIALVWGEAPPPSARKSLQAYVSRLRRSLGGGRITATADGYALRVDPDELDASRFEALAARGRAQLDEDAEAAWGSLTEALSLWRGAALSDVEGDGDLRAYVQRLEELRLATIEARLAAGLALGQHALLLGELRALTELHPLREQAWAQLMVALYRSGRQADALAAYRRHREHLAEELGLEPSGRLRELEARVLRQDPALDLDVPASAPPTRGPVRNPYKGLRAFTEGDAADFFGREALVEELVAELGRGDRFLALVGPSGSGKSSIALAGLLPALRRARAAPPLVAWMNPGTHPFVQLHAALCRASGEPVHLAPLRGEDELELLRAVLELVPDEHTDLVLVIDQFEELLTGAIAASTKRSFVRNLVEAVEDPHGQLVVVVTLRSDFLDEALREPGLAELLSTAAVNVPPLTSVELQAAVTKPARAVGLVVEPELVAELVTETAHHPGALPLLQFVLTELTDRAEGGELTLAALRRAGGIQGTLAQRAEELHAALPATSRDVVRRIFLQLVVLQDGGEPTRRVAVVDHLQLPGVDEQVRGQVLAALGRGRLLTLGRDPSSGARTVEVAHEAVLTAWPRCVRWIEEAAADIRSALELERAAVDWDAAGRGSDYLLTGSRLAHHEEHARQTEIRATPLAAAFLDASLVRRATEERAEEARARHERALERRAVRRLRVSVGILAVLVVVTSGLTTFAVAGSREVGRQRTAALSAASEVLVRQLSYAAVAEAGRDPERSLLLALHAVRVASLRDEVIPRETVEALHWGLQERGVPYPVEDADPLVLIGTEGHRGAFDLPAADLVRLAQDSVSRDLTAEECRTFLAAETCPALPADLADDLPAELADELPAQPALPLAAGAEPLAGTTVEIASGESGEGADALRAEFDRFTDATGIEVIHTEATAIYGRMERGQLQRQADVIVVAQPGSLETESAAGRLMDLERYLAREQLVADYGQHLIEMGTVGPDGRFGAERGTLHAVPFSAAPKSLIWYAPDRFRAAGYEVPATWEELLALSERIVADGGSPWCLAVEAGPATGWPVTDWVEDLLLREAGPEVYDALWIRQEIGFSDPRVRRAFERFGQVAFPDGYVHRGVATAETIPFTSGADPLFDDPPGCWLYHQANFAALFLPPGVEPGKDASAFVTPSIADAYADSMIGQFGFAMIYTDRPEVREFVRWLASPAFGHALLERMPEFIAVNARFDHDRYPEEWRRAAGHALARAQAADLVRTDGSDALPPWLGTEPIWEAMTDYLRDGPDALDGILARLDALEEEPG